MGRAQTLRMTKWQNNNCEPKLITPNVQHCEMCAGRNPLCFRFFTQTVKTEHANFTFGIIGINTNSIYAWWSSFLNKPRHEQTPAFCICENKAADQLRGSAFGFATKILKPFYCLNPKFQASSHRLWLYRPVCVGPDWIHQSRHIFSLCGSNII